MRLPRYELIYKDRYHQLLYKQGSFILVRGPLYRRTNKTPNIPFHVGISITSPRREQWLAIRPIYYKSAQELGTTRGTPVCTGRKTQFEYLKFPELTDEEVLVSWLDAGANIATGVTALHNQQSSLRRFVTKPKPIPTLRR